MTANDKMMSRDPVDISIILPTDCRDIGAFERIVSGYASSLEASARTWEIVVVPSVPTRETPMMTLTQLTGVQVCSPASGWGEAVTVGLQASHGELLCYTNWQRTSAEALAEMLELARHDLDVVLRANRRTRDTRVARIGSLLFNLECRLLLQVPAWDINGTPKIFPRKFVELLHLRQAGDLIDAEFALICERNGYPVIEVPVDAALQAGLSERRGARSAMCLYAGVFSLSRARR